MVRISNIPDEEIPIICVPWKVVQRIAQEIAPDVKWTKPACIALSYSCDDFFGELFLYADWVRKTSRKRVVHLNHFLVAKEIVNQTQKRHVTSCRISLQHSLYFLTLWLAAFQGWFGGKIWRSEINPPGLISPAGKVNPERARQVDDFQWKSMEIIANRWTLALSE